MREIDRRVIRRLIGHQASTEKIDEAAETLRRLAFEEWIDWIRGVYRPASISENASDRILKIYGEVLDDSPDVEQLVKRFNMPIGRARYLVSTLKYGSNPAFKRTVRRKLQAELTQVIKSKADDDDVTPFLRKALLDELDSLNVELLYENPDPEYEPYSKLRGPATVGQECRMPVATAKKLLERLHDRLELDEP